MDRQTPASLTHPRSRSGRWLRHLACSGMPHGETKRRSERGTALMETALTLPILLLVSVSIFEFGRAYQTWQVLTNAAREGARVAILPGSTTADVQARVNQYMAAGQIGIPQGTKVAVGPATVSLGGTGTASGTKVTVSYPFQFIVLNPVAKMVASNATLGTPFTMTVAAVMRNESQ
jgi:Flp pilus assembly protein TadG